MRRTTFTTKLASLIRYANENGVEVLLDYVKRDTQTQYRLYLEGKSKCDGYERQSNHQFGKAADLYVIKDGAICWDEEPYHTLHNLWDRMGGRPRISWDLGHFE